jgi:hypothetical protein
MDRISETTNLTNKDDLVNYDSHLRRKRIRELAVTK